MSSNSSLLRKADLAIEDLRADGGELLPEQGASFIRKLIKQPTLVRVCRVVEMTAPKRKINKIGFGSRILRKATSAVPLTEAQRAKPTTEQIELDVKEQIAEVRIPYDVMEDNIERAAAANNESSNTGPSGLRQTIIDLIAERAALDIEELALLADKNYTSSNADDQAYLAQLDGWLKRTDADGNVVDAEGESISKAIFKQGLKTLPSQYQRNKAAIRHFVSVNNETEYRDTLADRGTALGDQMTQGTSPTFAYGSPIEGVAMMPEDKGLYTDPLNLIFGIQRQVSMEFDKDITSRVYIIVLTTRIDFQIEETEAIVEYTNIGTV
ncbi:phage major capsid protein [Hyphomicrobium sp.]|uniref:phage major capsid protein n=1 Tax=Hyphomicrobium sp. TaxID=82 RepID=UPI001D9B2DEF|nr:phage major capsid protein [Hyphomicrobium sp.]MBY0560000.1 phage major capsid protein [Hyphomicrobium sp.]